MTQAACHLILFYSTARLAWKTIKSLRRSRTLLHNNKQAYDDDDDVLQEVEFEILQGWTILAFHSLFVATGVEYAVRFIIPFYYHLKMLMLIAFTLPSWALRRKCDGNEDDSSYGLSPFIPFCFNNIIVPGVHRVHELMDNDPRGWALYVISLTPLLILDYIFLPGVLLTEEERMMVRNARLVEKKRKSHPPRNAFPTTISKATTDVSSTVSGLHEIIPNEQIKMERKTITETKHPETPPHNKEETEQPTSCSTPTQRIIYSFTQTPLSPFLNRSGKKTSYNLSGFSPLAKSRITSSALRLRQFSRDHNLLSSIKPISSKSKENKTPHAQEDDRVKLPNIRRRNKVSDDVFASSYDNLDPMDISDIDDEDEPPQQPKVRRNKRRERFSFGDHFREMVTGDASIRVRDHLFDLELPSVPSPSPRRLRGGNVSGNGGDINCSDNNKKNGLQLSPNVTTRRRRSSRLAKQKG